MRLAQILGHLLGNAIKFSERGIVTIRASRDDTGAAPMLKFVVTDEGIGIAPEMRSQLFSRFSQGDGSTTRRFGGAGLGLALCKRLVNLMAGDMGYLSTPGEGSSFWFVVPLILPSAHMSAAAKVLSGEDVRPASQEEIDQLAVLLGQGELEARDAWGRIRENLRQSLQDKFETIDAAIASFDFELALTLLQAATRD